MNKKRAAAIFAAILSCYAISATAASYYSAKTGGSGVGIAKWDVSVEFMGENDFTLIDSEGKRTAEYFFSVTSKSEVALSYEIVLTMPKAIPDGLSFIIKDINDGDILPSISEDGLTYTFVNADDFRFSANGGKNEHTLEISTDFTHNSIALEDIEVRVIASQLY